MVPLSFFPLKKKGGLQGKIQSELCLTKEQAKQIYDKIGSGEEVKIKENNAAEYFCIVKTSDI